MSSASIRAVTRWATRIMPLVLAVCIGFATYVVSKVICVDFFLGLKGRPDAAIALLSVYFVLLLLLLLTYQRLILVITFDPGLLPAGEDATSRKKPKRGKSTYNHRDIESQPYQPGSDTDPDSPGLERFYSKDVFVCEPDGRPRWCSNCRVWKNDRAHHSREINRCVRRMDHYCPWVGGIVSETSFKFFVQFVFYATLYCSLCLVATILCLKEQITGNGSLDGTVIAVIALGAFFGLFTLGMTLTSLRYILINLTNVDAIRQKSIVYQLAIRVPLDTPTSQNYSLITYPLPRPNGCSYPSSEESASPRDRLALRKFAIVRTDLGENPWDLGLYGNWISVMGTNMLDWFLPFRKSPCIFYENSKSFYQMGPLYDALRTRYGLPKLLDDGREGIEMMTLDGRAIAGEQ